MKRAAKSVVKKGIDVTMYSVFSEKQRKKIGDLLPENQKRFIQKLSKNGEKYKRKQKLKQLRYHLYTLGFEERALGDLKALYEEETMAYFKRRIAFEIALWHMNHQTAEEAKLAVPYLKEAAFQESDQDQLRRITILIAESSTLLERKDLAQDVLLRLLEKHQHPDIYLGLVNTEDTIDAKLNWLNQAMEMYELMPVSFDSSSVETQYDDLTMEEMPLAKINGPKVSVIIPAYNAGEGIRTAIESILHQTWSNLELLVVDDHSTDHTRDVVLEYANQDARVTLLQTPVNSGPYVARNVALKEATGEFVTINDSDDWSHVEKIARQAEHLVSNPKVIANTSEHARLTEELTFFRRGTPGRYIFPNMSSIMFRRKPVIEELGYWDPVRFAADGEFKRRLIQQFGKFKYVDLETGPVSMPRQTTSSLTGSSAFGYNGHFKGVRKFYVESMEHYHHSNLPLYYPFTQAERPFYVPEPMWPVREEKQEGFRDFDVIVCADFRTVFNEDIKTYDYIKKLIASDKKVGFVQFYKYDLEEERGISSRLHSLLYQANDAHVLVYGEKAFADQIVILDDAVLQDDQKYVPAFTGEELLISDIRLGEALKQKFQVNDINQLNL
ncbi:glycosyltransferase family 2 protein [Halalkalibacillus halophilus]|uniref:glycosyltransferase family 2 protein n=1 Tax=Halalkalibacillus halophilus TaxID=392827 RepID=UPI000417CECF|nr:glycosyltransferase family A protein [Halalkalibacillus halophilus]